MKAIVAVDLNWGIGYKGELLQRIPEDQRFFRQMTTGKIVVMGRETFESLPGQQPLKNRVNIVLSRNEDFTNDKVIICRSLDELFSKLSKYPPADIFVIGGESIYTQLLPYCSEVYVTRIYGEYTADTHFPNLDEMGNWEMITISEEKTYNNIKFIFLKYINRGI